jgi:uncharacterized protein (DUF433 family)
MSFWSNVTGTLILQTYQDGKCLQIGSKRTGADTATMRCVARLNPFRDRTTTSTYNAGGGDQCSDSIGSRLIPISSVEKACIRGMRISVPLIVNLVANGMTVPEIISEYPDIEEEDVTQALRYAARASDDVFIPSSETA